MAMATAAVVYMHWGLWETLCIFRFSCSILPSNPGGSSHHSRFIDEETETWRT